MKSARIVSTWLSSTRSIENSGGWIVLNKMITGIGGTIIQMPVGRSTETRQY
jgi:hypothetical protein